MPRKGYPVNQLKLQAYAKINLTLEVLEQRPDKYHNLRSVFQQISLCDDLIVQSATGEGLILNDCPDVLAKDNILTKAYTAMTNHLGHSPAIVATLKKRIPSQAGLGGGSADCAAFLSALNTLWGMNLDRDQLCKIGATLGADVSSCIYGGSLFAGGIGDIITPIDSSLSLPLVIIKPPVACSTPHMYKRLDEAPQRLSTSSNTGAVLSALQNGNISALCQNLHNDFQTLADYPEIISAGDNLINCGAMATLLCGSGSAVFGIFKEPKVAISAYHRLKKAHKTYLCRTIPTHKNKGATL